MADTPSEGAAENTGTGTAAPPTPEAVEAMPDLETVPAAAPPPPETPEDHIDLQLAAVIRQHLLDQRDMLRSGLDSIKQTVAQAATMIADYEARLAHTVKLLEQSGWVEPISGDSDAAIAERLKRNTTPVLPGEG